MYGGTYTKYHLDRDRAIVESQRKAEAYRLQVRARVRELETTGTQCNCDLDRYEPEQLTGHSFVCRIHRTALGLGPIR